MSTIAVVRKNGQIAIAADSLSSYGATNMRAQYDRRPEKVFEFNGSYIGVVGSAAHNLVLESAFKRLDQPPVLDSIDSIFETFRQLHPILKKDYYLLSEEEGEQPYESSQIDVLIANRFGIFGVLSYREVFEYDRFWATGTGWQVALGAMYSVYDGGANAEDVARAALNAACEFDQASAMPMSCKVISCERDS